jgi:hypothetical protein
MLGNVRNYRIDMTSPTHIDQRVFLKTGSSLTGQMLSDTQSHGARPPPDHRNPRDSGSAFSAIIIASQGAYRLLESVTTEKYCILMKF